MHAQARLAESSLHEAAARAQQAEQAVTAAKCASLHTRLDEQREDKAERDAQAAADQAALREVGAAAKPFLGDRSKLESCAPMRMIMKKTAACSVKAHPPSISLPTATIADPQSH